MGIFVYFQQMALKRMKGKASNLIQLGEESVRVLNETPFVNATLVPNIFKVGEESIRNANNKAPVVKGALVPNILKVGEESVRVLAPLVNAKVVKE
jgi:hypothetical protein